MFNRERHSASQSIRPENGFVLLRTQLQRLIDLV